MLSTSSGAAAETVASPSKGKGKAPAADQSMEEDEEDEEEEDDEEEEEEDEDDEADETFDEIDPSVIIGGRRTRGVKVDYTSKEALERAGLQDNEKDEEDDEDVEMKD
ncbi:hypothetical protein H0H81_007113 [Sphagnurus paluster]|uniref:Histone chaperone domain-containing protein n=1 Tax=Sphagnurus paluster TaxID=117069 RepID=A0A9P7KGT3_9AGAR|nr:hypothetical protein H0H81_007113 [Sphagnurus paluster]